jgi:5-deoxy-D-glucuronate isomerase
MLSILSAIKKLVGKDTQRDYRGAGVKRTIVTAIKYISVSGEALSPIIILPVSTHQSNWTTYPTPG